MCEYCNSSSTLCKGKCSIIRLLWMVVKMDSHSKKDIVKNNFPIYLYGAIILLVGLYLIFSENTVFELINVKISIPLIIGSSFAFIAAFSRQRKRIQFAYHEMHALTMLVYGISILVFCYSFEMFFSFTAFLFLFYSFSEIIFCSWLFNLGEKISFRIVIVRIMLGLAVGIGTVVAMYFSTYSMIVFGILFLTVGINIMLYVPVMIGSETSKTQ
jgi:hypothetical protein